MQNLHVIIKQLTGAAGALPLPTPHGILQLISLIPSQSRDLIACTFFPHSIKIYALQTNRLDELQSIAVDFNPFSSIWLPTMKALLVFDLISSDRVASVLIESTSEIIHILQLVDEIDLQSICRLRCDEKTRKERVIFFDFVRESLLEFELS